MTIAGKQYSVVSDSCVPGPASTTSLGGLLGQNFVGYGEGWDSTNPSACTIQSTYYAQKHCPWTMFQDSKAASHPFTDFPTAAFDQLPLVSMVTPNLIHDMHSLPGNTDFNVESLEIPLLVRNGDQWLQANLNAYVEWAKTNNSLLIITFDENSRASEEGTDNGARFDMPKNHIATVFVGPMVKPGSGNGNVVYNHYDLLRTIEDMYGLPHIGGSASAKPITGIWQK